MENVMEIFKALFNALNISFMGMPLIAWLVIPAFFLLIAGFVRGKK